MTRAQDANGLLELAERCEQATGPDASIDWDIEAEIGDWENLGGARLRHKTAGDIRVGYAHPRGAYTASLDAAMTLVPEGHDFGVGRGLDDVPPQGWAWCGAREGPLCWTATPALALCAAVLRARAAQ